MAVSIPGVIAMVFFYLLILGVGIWAFFMAKKENNKGPAESMEVTLLGNRSINRVVGSFTTAATWIGGGFILGISEMVYDPSMGLIGASTYIIGDLMALIIGGLFFAGPMRECKYVTMMDPFLIKYGKVPSAVLSLATLVTDCLWVTTTLMGLGAAMSVILNLPVVICNWISAAVAVFYTLMGGLFSVAYTDVVQLILMFISLWFCVPFVLMNPASLSITETAMNNTLHASWIGVLGADQAWGWLDSALVLTLGCLGYQEFHQRTLSASSSATAKINCFVGSALIIIFAIPPVLIGAVAASTDWNLTSYGSPSPFERGETAVIMPITMQHLTPVYVSIISVGCITAAVMSSCDSALLAAASVFTNNIYKSVLRTQASDWEIQLVIRVCVVVTGLVSTSLTSLQSSIVALWFLSTFITYIVVFPQLVCVLFCKISNGYGAVVGCLVGLLLRLLCGEPMAGLPVVIHLPGCTLEDDVYVQRSPVNTICMLVVFAAVPFFSYLFSKLIHKNLITKKWDTFNMMVQKPPKQQTCKEKEDDFCDQDVSAPMMSTRC